MVAQVKDLLKQLDLLKVRSAKMEKRVVGVEERAGKAEEKTTLLEQEMQKHLNEGVEEYKKSVSFDMDGVIACHSTFMVVFSSIEEDLHAINPVFPLDRLKCMKDYLEMQAGEKEVEEDVESKTRVHRNQRK